MTGGSEREAKEKKAKKGKEIACCGEEKPARRVAIADMT